MLKQETTESLKVDHVRLSRFVCDVLNAVGVDESEAAVISDAMVWADLAGRSAQGVWRLPVYVKKIEEGSIRSPCLPEFSKKSEAIHLLDGHDGFGHYVSHLAMTKAIEVAGQSGIGLVGVRNSNHFGAAAYYVNMAAETFKLGLAFSNATSSVAPFGATDAILGTNPIAFGAPLRDGRSVLVDLSTSTSSRSAIRKAAEEGQPIADGILIDKTGQSVTHPAEMAGSVGLPFGDAKGFCLGLMVEILCGVITGARISTEISSLLREPEKTSGVGHLFLAIDIKRFMEADGYHRRMDPLIRAIKTAKPRNGVSEILIPGETRWRHRDRQLAEGVTLDPRTADSLTALAGKLNLTTPW